MSSFEDLTRHRDGTPQHPIQSVPQNWEKLRQDDRVCVQKGFCG